MKEKYMNRENYEKVVEILGEEYILNGSGGKLEDFTSDTRIDIDNSTGKATKVLERIVDYVDALLYDAYHYKPEVIDGWKSSEPEKASDMFEFIIEDMRYTLQIDHMVHDADEMEWEEWMAVGEKILHAKKVCIEYWYSMDTFAAEILVDRALKRVLDDLLVDGCLADYVSMQIKILPGDILFVSKPVREMEGCRYLWMNGMRNGQYFCGEIPFEHNEERLRSCGGWREADYSGTEEGIRLQLHPKTSRKLLKRVREAAKAFEQKIDCEMELRLSYNDFRNAYLEFHAELEDAVVGCIDKSIDDKLQRKFPDLRVYFTPEEKQMLLDRYAVLSEKYVQYADSSYTKDDLERIRFLWTLLLMEIFEGPEEFDIWKKLPKATDEYLEVFYALPKDIRLRLYGIRDYDEMTLHSGEKILVMPKVREGRFVGGHSGIGDLSIMDDELCTCILNEGYTVHVNNIHLKDIDDVRRICDFMNELKEIERLAQIENGEPISHIEDKWMKVYYHGLYWDSFELKKAEENGRDTKFEKMEAISMMTLREFHEQACNMELENMNQMRVGGYDEDEFSFESDENSQWARLRFRLENGKYIYEIAQVDV